MIGDIHTVASGLAVHPSVEPKALIFCIVAMALATRPEPIMLFKLPIMLLSIAPKIYLL